VRGVGPGGCHHRSVLHPTRSGRGSPANRLETAGVSDYADIEAIKQLKARYFRFMDTKDWDGLASVFTADVEIDMTGEGGGVTTTVEEYLPFLRGNIEHVVTVHHGHMPEIEVTSAPRRRGSGPWRITCVGRRVLPWRVARLRPLHETYRKTPDGWRIASMRLTRLRRDLDVPRRRLNGRRAQTSTPANC